MCLWSGQGTRTDYGVITGGERMDGSGVRVRRRRTADQHELPARQLRGAKCVDQIELTLLGHQTADLNDIVLARQLVLVEQCVARRHRLRADTVWNPGRLPSVLCTQGRLHAGGYGDQRVGKSHCEELAEANQRLLRAAPFLAQVILPMVCDDDAKSQYFRQRDGNRGAHRVYVQHIWPTNARAEDCQDGMDRGLEATPPRGP